VRFGTGSTRCLRRGVAKEATPARIFIGSSTSCVVEETVMVQSLLRHSSIPLTIDVIDGTSGSVRRGPARARCVTCPTPEPARSRAEATSAAPGLVRPSCVATKGERSTSNVINCYLVTSPNCGAARGASQGIPTATPGSESCWE
jgi:hypothetical protein